MVIRLPEMGSNMDLMMAQTTVGLVLVVMIVLTYSTVGIIRNTVAWAAAPVSGAGVAWCRRRKRALQTVA